MSVGQKLAIIFLGWASGGSFERLAHGVDHGWLWVAGDLINVFLAPVVAWLMLGQRWRDT